MKQVQILRASVIGLVVLTIVLMISGMSGAALNPSSTAVGYVSLEELQRNLPEFEESKRDMESLMLTYNQFFQYKQSEFNNAAKDLDSQKAKELQGKSEADKKAIEAKYDDLKRKRFEETQKEIDAKKSEITGKINDNRQATMNKVRKTIEQVAKAQGISLVLEEQVIYYGGVNLTSRVIDAAKKK